MKLFLDLGIRIFFWFLMKVGGILIVLLGVVVAVIAVVVYLEIKVGLTDISIALVKLGHNYTMINAPR